ncbi:hypothetical protein BST81_03280 [Leptolyngbya sp. 'hensonii']|nr:hypothetical protein BST81_03280 [Leptolyngbya sp. 'hensonii']
MTFQGRLARWGILGFSGAPLIGAHFYNQGFQIPFLVCPIRHLTGIPCPTCGMTRSFMAIARGDLPQAVTEHLLGPVLFIVFLLAIVHVLLELGTGRNFQAPYLRILGDRVFQVSTLSVILGYYSIRLVHLASTGELMAALIQSPLGQLAHLT